MQPLKQGQGMTLQLPFIATYPTARITSGSSAPSRLYPGGTDGTCLTSSNQRGGGGSSHGFRARRRHHYWQHYSQQPLDLPEV